MQYILLRHKTANQKCYTWLFYELKGKSILALEQGISSSRENMEEVI